METITIEKIIKFENEIDSIDIINIDDELINISDSNNKSIITFKGSKNFNNMVLCTSDFITGETYTVSIGGNIDGDIKDGICSGTYSGGEVYESFTIQGNCTD